MPSFKTKYAGEVPEITSTVSFVTDTDENNFKLKNPQAHLPPYIPGRLKNPPDSQGSHLPGCLKHSHARLAPQGNWRLGVNIKSKYMLEIWERKR